MKTFLTRMTRRRLLLSLLTLAAFKQFKGQALAAPANGDETVISGGWLLKKSDLR